MATYAPVPQTDTKLVIPVPPKDPKQTKGYPAFSPGFWLNFIVFVLAVGMTFLFGELELNMQYAFGPSVLMWINLVIFVFVALFTFLVGFQLKSGGPKIVGYENHTVYDPLQFFFSFAALFYIMVSYGYLVAKQLALYQHYKGFIGQWNDFQIKKAPVEYESMHRVFADAQHGFHVALGVYTVMLLFLFFFERYPIYTRSMRTVILLQKNKISPEQFARDILLLEGVN